MSQDSPETEPVPVYIVTGLSGAGKTTALDAFEDLAYFVIDGLPAALVPQIARLMNQPAMSHYKGLAIGIDLRQPSFLGDLQNSLVELEACQLKPKLLFLEADEAELLRRYAFTRRPHPLEGEKLGLAQALKNERTRLQPLRSQASMVIDSSDFSIHNMRQVIQKSVHPLESGQHELRLNILSFGFKYGIPADADFVFDLRFLPNPFLVAELRSLSGNSPEVAEYIFSSGLSGKFCDKTLAYLGFILPQMEKDMRPRLTLAFGCTGGRHRSVAIANRMAELLKVEGYPVLVEHRNICDDPQKKKGLPG